MSVEHASQELIGRYTRGERDIPVDEVWALEAHLESCALCRERLSGVVAEQVPAVASVLGTVWSGLEPELGSLPPMPPSRRWNRRLTLWMTPVMLPWLLTIACVTFLAVLLDRLYAETGGAGGGIGAGIAAGAGAGAGGADGGGHVSLVLLLAPLLPVLGVAASWSGGIDPAYELTAAVPRAGLDMVLRRTAAVLVVLLPPLWLGGWATGLMVAQWLLPALAFTAAALALGGVIGVTRAAVALAVVWAAVIVAPAEAFSRTPLLLRPEQLPLWALALALGVAVVLVRKGAYTVLGARR